MLVLSSNVLRSTQVFMAVLSLMDVIRRNILKSTKLMVTPARLIL